MVSQDKRQAIYFLCKSGMVKREISRRLKVDRKTVNAIIAQKGIMPEIKSRKKIIINKELLFKVYCECNGKIMLLQKKLIEREGIKIGHSTLTKMIRESEFDKLKYSGIRNFDRHIIKAELYNCMIKGKPYIEVLQQIFFKNIKNNDLSLNEDERKIVIRNGKSGRFKIWRYGIIIDMFGIGIPKKIIFEITDVPLDTIKRKIKEYKDYGFDKIIKKIAHKTTKKATDIKTKRIIEILHQKPKLFGINRSNWNRKSISKAYEKQYGEKIEVRTVGRLINNAGYRIKKAKKVLTSPDPNYREKVELLLKTLQSLNFGEMFFFIDELGPLQVRKYGGRCYVKKDEILRLPKIQKSKGSITLFGALSATTNQVTWCYGKSKDTSAMINIIEILFNQHYDKSILYITWDAVSWHSSNELETWLDVFNNQTKEIGAGPIIVLIPLPSSSQFLDVIEAVFSGMKRAVVHHSDYGSEEEMKFAISGHFKERNEFFKENPRRAGKKIWEIDFFLDYNNIKFGDYMEW